MPWDSCLDPNGVATLACIPIVVKNVVNALLTFSGIIALFLFIFSGAKYITSKGDPAALDSAKKTLTYAILGLVIIFLSFFIVNIIASVTGVDQISNPTL